MKRAIGKAVPKIIGLYLNSLSYIAPKIAADKALALFATPRKGKILDDQRSFLNTSTEEIIYFNDLPVKTYSWEGSGKSVLLAHGWESNAFRWHKLVRRLQQENYHVIALDAPAHGDSGSSQFNAVLYADFINIAAERYQPNFIVGHSVGGMASVFFQKKYQLPTLHKLVLLGAPSEFVNVFKGYTSMLGINSHLKRHLTTLIIERFGDTPESFSTAQYLNAIDIKGLLIHDRHDKIIAYEEALLIKDNFKNAQLISTEGLGHSLHDDSVNHHIVEFLNS